MNKIKYVGKCLLIENKKERNLVIGDLHLGYEGVLRKSGFFVPVKIYDEILKDFDEIYSALDEEKENKEKIIDKIIILGDVKHEFGTILKEEWNEIEKFLNYLRRKCNELIVIEGNHDKILFPILKKLKITASEYYIWKGTAFVHGDRSFKEIEGKEIEFWIMGHGHPAIVLSEENKNEKYKCFLEGKYKNKKIIIVPSFFPVTEGVDPRQNEIKFAWKFDLMNFNVKIISEKLEVLDFGILKDIN